MKIRIGIIFGGSSREREVSFAGGRTVYDNLDKSLFDAVPLFADSFGNLIILDWQYVYKGSIRDFYPHIESLPESANEFQIYAESIGDLTISEQIKLSSKLGTKIEPSALSEIIDIAFLCLHGNDGEDGRIQGLLEYYRIPYTGSGILSSAIGMNKVVQKKLMQHAGFNVPAFFSVTRNEWKNNSIKNFAEVIEKNVGLPCVIKPANQGSSIGVSVITKENITALTDAVNKAFFFHTIKRENFTQLTHEQRVEYIRTLADIREGIGMPVKIGSKIIFHPEELLSVVLNLFSEMDEEVTIEAVEAESEVLIEQFIEGKEFSCIVIENTDGKPCALPPTEIRKGKEVFDYRSKYLPGLSRKITPIQIDDAGIEKIRTECAKLYSALQFNVYARIDGFYDSNGKVFLNDPNTTSGMMPSSFFFHQAAEIGLNPSQFITYIIYVSLKNRLNDLKNYRSTPLLLERFNRLLADKKSQQKKKTRIAVIMGGYSTERHISVESGRNIYEKLSSSEKYEPIPFFLMGNDTAHEIYRIPVNILLKDNADDIKEKILSFKRHSIINKIIEECKELTENYASEKNLEAPVKTTYDDLAKQVEGVFIALHGRPGEDGVIQQNLIRVGLPFNGSGVESSQTTIDKFKTNEILLQQGFKAAAHMLVFEDEWRNNPSAIEDKIKAQFSFPVIAKPVDDGCSSAVKVIRNENQFHAFAELMFRKEDALNEKAAALLKVKFNEEFPRKKSFLIETLVNAEGTKHFLEVTGGMLTHYNAKGEVEFEMFEPSETLSEGEVLSLEEKFLAGQGQNITPARYSKVSLENKMIAEVVKKQLKDAATLLNIQGYARIDAFVKIKEDNRVEVFFIEVNSLPGMTPATCIFHQAAINHYKPYDFIDKILEFGFQRKAMKVQAK